MWNIKYNTNEIYKKQKLKTNLWLPKGIAGVGDREKLGVGD